MRESARLRLLLERRGSYRIIAAAAASGELRPVELGGLDRGFKLWAQRLLTGKAA